MKRLEDKVALVTGAGRRKGIGFACAIRLAEEGANVVIADYPGVNPEAGNDSKFGKNGSEASSVEGLNSLTGTLAEKGVRALALEVDVTDEKSVQNMFANIKKEMGRLDVLVNNAGIAGTPAPLTQTELDSWTKALTVNLTGTFLCSREAVSLLMEDGGGSIINMSSRAAYKGAIWLHAYSASKGGVLGLTRSMALELALLNIRVNAVCPGHIDTELKRWGWEKEATVKGKSMDEIMASAAETTPLGRIGLPEDVAAAVAFLASGDSGYITGEAISITGGDGNRTVF